MSKEHVFNEPKNDDVFFGQLLQYRSQITDEAFVEGILNRNKYLHYKRMLILSVFGVIGLLLFFWQAQSLTFISNFSLPKIEPLTIQFMVNIMLIGVFFISTWLAIEEI